jgi:cysteinyl-tRNA synthetase
VDGSVYFDTKEFDDKGGHHYAKLQPWSAGNEGLIEEGEGSLGSRLLGKKNKSDFALWKKSKPGEPSWESPWGPVSIGKQHISYIYYYNTFYKLGTTWLAYRMFCDG